MKWSKDYALNKQSKSTSTKLKVLCDNENKSSKNFFEIQLEIESPNVLGNL